MKIRNQHNQEGFIAVTSAVVIAALLIIVGASLGYTNFYSRFNILTGEFKDVSTALASACAEIARVEIANNANFTAPASAYTVVNSPLQQCNIISVTNSGANYTVQSRGIYPTTGAQQSYSIIEAVYNRTASDVVVTAWKEIP